MNAPGRFITAEGIDGAGKTTHLDAVESWLPSETTVIALYWLASGCAVAAMPCCARASPAARRWQKPFASWCCTDRWTR